MRVIADLHGGDPEDLIAKAEFQEIKDRVIFEVRTTIHWLLIEGTDAGLSARVVKVAPMRTCGNDTSGVFCSLCPRRPSLN